MTTCDNNACFINLYPANSAGRDPHHIIVFIIVSTMSNCTEYPICSSIFEKIGYLGLLPMTCALGVGFNGAILRIFLNSSFKLHMIPSTLIYLTGLAVADFHSSLLIAPLGFTRCIPPSSPDVQLFYNIYEKYIKNIGNIFTTAGIFITLTVTIERFLFVIKSKGDLARSNSGGPVPAAVKILVGNYILAFVCCIPLFLSFDNVSPNEPVQKSNFAESTGYEVYAWFGLLVLKLTPVLTISMLNMVLIGNIRDNNKRLKAMVFSTIVYRRRMQSQNRITLMLLSISAVFILGHLFEPFVDTGIIKPLFGKCSTETIEYETIRMFANWVESLTWTSNFVSYYVFNASFKIHVRNLISCNKQENRSIRQRSKWEKFSFAVNTKVSTTYYFSRP